jgi:NADH dehydrogenase/NADH:ubiquinone oxidoreductase subunit G
MADVTLTIDGDTVAVPSGTTILKAAQQLGRSIPTICYHDHCTANGLCRICVVEINGVKPLVPACLTPVREGSEVSTSSVRAERSRRTILEMLASAVDLSEAPEIERLMADYRADPARFPDAERREYPVLDDNPMYIRDYSKCILCWRCVQVCADDAQFTYAINFTGRGFETSIGTFFDKPMPETTCVFCGQCVGVCPTGALKSKRESLLEQGFSLDEIMQATRGEKKRRRKSP